MPPTLDDARDVLRRHFGFDDFRGVQAEAVACVLAGGDVLVLMPTGGGKSLCYQVPALLLPGLTLVVSPLVSLMQDQVEGLRKRSVAAGAIHGGVPRADARAMLQASISGRLRLLYVAPERFDSVEFRRALDAMRVSLLVVDEAHCVSHWGEAFRPAYQRLGQVRASLMCPAMALTATATLEVRRDVMKCLGLRSPRILAGGFDRPNLHWSAVELTSRQARDAWLAKMVSRASAASVLVYAATRREVEQLADRLNAGGIRAASYHAGQAAARRAALQDRFMSGATRVMVATSAFGMGIDKPDVRLVVHAQPSGSLEAYYQEAGRAGRDGGAARCVLAFSERDRETLRFLVEQAYPSESVVRAVHAWLCSMAPGAGDVPLDADACVRRTAAVRGAAQVEAAVRVLERGRACRVVMRRGDPPVWVRLMALPLRVERELSAVGRAEEREMLERLLGLCGEAQLRRGTEVGLAELAGGDRAGASAVLDRLRAGGFLDWRRPPRRLVTALRGRPGDPPVDWRNLKRGRRREEQRVERVFGYARHKGCRRALLLEHFGETARGHCGNCDNCTTRRRGSGPFARHWNRRNLTGEHG